MSDPAPPSSIAPVPDLSLPDTPAPDTPAPDTPAPGQGQPQTAALPGGVATYPLRFTGNVPDYFRIWMVNIALSVVTLGIYIPWARVRTRQYFYGHTWLDGHNFEYTARPAALLRGYLIVAAFALIYGVSSQFPYRGSEVVAGAVGLLFVLVYPWLVWQSMRFLARSTVHRGLSFRFTGSLSGAYINYGLANIAAAISGGLALPWAWFMQRRYQVEGVGYGAARGRFRGEAGRFYVIALIGLALALGGLMVVGLLAAFIFVALGLAIPDLFKLKNDDVGTGIYAVVFTLYLGFLLIYGVAGQYVRAATMQYVLDHVELGGVVRLHTTFSPWMFTWISLSNYAAQVLSLGLLTPWAAIRRTRYLLEHVQVRAIASLDDFAATQTGEESALGEAATELFDINLGF